MKILYDNQIFINQKVGGVSRYFVELMKNSKFDYGLTGLFSNNYYLSELSMKKFYLFPEFNFIGRRSLINQFYKIDLKKSIFDLKNKKYDLFHPTYYDPYFVKYLENPIVLTVYDMIHEIYPNYFIDDKTSENKKQLCSKANKIIAISKNTKKDLINFFDIPKDLIEVVYLGCNLIDIKPEYIKTPKKFILFVGARGGYKNFDFFVKSIADLIIKHSINLICVGSKFSDNEINLLRELKLLDLTKSLSTTDSELKYLYKNALFFVFPSLYEGFGMPVLEAFGSGCPVALSKASCFPEIAQKNAVYFDPLNQDSIKNCVEDLIVNKKKRKLLSKKGFNRAKDFFWKKTAIETKKVYEHVLK